MTQCRKQEKRAAEFLPEELRQYISEENEITEISYPVIEYPIKVNSLNLDKNPEFSSSLKGIKGQYLLFANGIVFNVRKHGGYHIKLEF